MKRPPRACAVWLGLLLLGLLGEPLIGSTLVLRTAPSAHVRNGRAQVTLRITNLGDETAGDVTAAVSLGSATNSEFVAAYLPSGTSATAHVEFDALPRPPGIHTARIVIRYLDANGYPFASICTLPVVTADIPPGSGPIELHVARASRKTVHDFDVFLDSRHNLPVEAALALLLPDELTCDAPMVTLGVNPGNTTEHRFTVDSSLARPGSTVPVRVIADCVIDGLHYSAVADTALRIRAYPGILRSVRRGIGTIIVGLLLIVVAIQFCTRRGLSSNEPAGHPPICRRTTAAVILLSLTGFILFFLSPSALFLDTTTVGGDTPAHNYLAGHLRDTLFREGRIVSWAPGWWCGFPMFQFYFCLPYVLMAFANLVLPFNVAFKVVSVLGMLLLPVAAWQAARWLRLPRPGPLLVAIATLPFLFDNTHTMWGVNIYSTLAGMLSNSLSFPIMLLAVAAAWRDADDGVFRVRTVLLIAAMIASHFFTSVVAALIVIGLPLFGPASGFRRSASVLAREGVLAALLMAWWLVPLVAKQDYTAEFGVNWELAKFAPCLRDLKFLALPVLVGLVLGIVRRCRFVMVNVWMLAIALLLFWRGYSLSPVFVNVRLWPFILWALLSLAAAGVGWVVERIRGQGLAVMAVALFAMVFGVRAPALVTSWSRWNYEGLEKKPRWPVFRDLVLPLDGTPGRLANDLHAYNASLGSSRIFECVPHLIRKSILEGGILSSSTTPAFSYYVQSETSDSCAGFPNTVEPTTFNWPQATRHLQLMNVKHFIARSPRTQAALAASPDWKCLRNSQGWELHELTTHDGRLVVIPPYHPIAVVTQDWKRAGVEWFYVFQAVDQPFVFLHPDTPDARFTHPLPPESFSRWLADAAAGASPHPAPAAVDGMSNAVIDEIVTNHSIRFRTRAVGMPHLIKCSYFPNWKVRGADCIYRVTPGFMLVYPNRPEVELYYGSTAADHAGRGLTLAALVALGAVLVHRRTRVAPCTTS